MFPASILLLYCYSSAMPYKHIILVPDYSHYLLLAEFAHRGYPVSPLRCYPTLFGFLESAPFSTLDRLRHFRTSSFVSVTSSSLCGRTHASLGSPSWLDLLVGSGLPGMVASTIVHGKAQKKKAAT